MFTENQLFEIFGFYEKDRFIHVKAGYEIRCSHSKPALTDWSPAPLYKTNETTVRLQQYALKDEKLGLAGKCEACGKVYYK